MENKKRLSILILSIIGLLLTIELCVVYYNANFVPNADPSICAINDTMNCDEVARTKYSQFLGIPLSLWGFCLYLFIILMSFVDKLQNIKGFGILKVFKNPASYIFCISLLSFIISMFLGGISIFKIHSVCIFCIMTYVIDLLIALTAKSYGEGLFKELKDSIKDFTEAIKVPKNLFWFSLVVILGAAIVTYTSVSKVLTPNLLHKNAFSINGARGNILGDPNADVVVHEYVDFNCQGCFLATLFLHRIINEVDNVRVEQHTLPLEQICNPNMQSEGHKSSCIKAQYARAAAKQNKYWAMVNLLFFNDEVTDENKILELAKKHRFNIEKLKNDAHSQEIMDEIKDSIADADSKEIVGTPTIIIGMRRLDGIGSYPDLKAIIIEQGGREKKND